MSIVMLKDTLAINKLTMLPYLFYSSFATFVTVEQFVKVDHLFILEISLSVFHFMYFIYLSGDKRNIYIQKKNCVAVWQIWRNIRDNVEGEHIRLVTI